jgi:hypothetical protein
MTMGKKVMETERRSKEKNWEKVILTGIIQTPPRLGSGLGML